MFRKCRSVAEVKKLYRLLALRLHPDYGGSNELMALLIEVYEEALDSATYEERNDNKKKETKTEKSYYDENEYGDGLYKCVNEDVQQKDPRLKIFMDILEYAKEHKTFKTDFVLSLVEFLDEKGFLTPAQYNKLVKIYYAFHMDKSEKTV